VWTRRLARHHTRLLPGLETISYGDLWTRVCALAAKWRVMEVRAIPATFGNRWFLPAPLSDRRHGGTYLGLGSPPPLQHNAPVSQLRPSSPRSSRGCSPRRGPIWRVAIESVSDSESLRHGRRVRLTDPRD